jgi:hypothetical protein
MPIFFVTCPVCKQSDRRFLPALDRCKCRKTKNCIGTVERQITAPSMVHKERIDNGLMLRSIEHDIDVDKVRHEHARVDLRKR